MSLVDINHFHLFCGLGSGAAGFNDGEARVGQIQGNFVCLGGIDVDPAGIRDFERLTGVPGTLMDLFDRVQYRAFHGREPGSDWREALPADIHRAAGNKHPHIIFLSAPCKGFSGLLSEAKSLTDKYQALNQLTERGVWLALEAFADDPVELFVFENVPRLLTRGRPLVDRIMSMFRHFGYVARETTHDCGKLGGLAQSRKRCLIVARHIEKVPPLLYEPEQRQLRAVGDVLGKMPLPGVGGPMHRVPSLAWKTWVRLAFVEAGSDWRSLNKLVVENGHLRDYLIVPEMHRGGYGVRNWDDPSGVVQGESRPSNGSFSVADPRFEQSAKWTDGQAYIVKRWDEARGAITGASAPGSSAQAVADPRLEVKHNNCFRIVRFDQASGTVTAGTGPSAGGQGVADPRPEWNRHGSNMRVGRWDEPAATIIAGGKGVQGGWQSIADPRPRPGPLFSKYPVTEWDAAARTVIGGDDTGAYAVADPRSGMSPQRSAYQTGGHYGVTHWGESCGAVASAASYDNGRWSVADPRLPAIDEKLIAVIRSLDGTWHRPFTTLELAALQSLFDPEDPVEAAAFGLDGTSDSAWRERIGNAVPRRAAAAIASEMGRTLLLAWSGETFALSAAPVWVRPVVVGLSLQGGAL